MTEYEVYAVRYASAHDRLSEQNFLVPPVRGASMRMDYFFWLVQGGGRNVLVDAGFTAESGLARGRPVDRDLVECLRDCDLDPSDIDDVIVTHLHFDHTGFLDRFPRARIHLQQAEWTAILSNIARHDTMRWMYEEKDIHTLVKIAFEGRLDLHGGDADLCPGVRLWLLPGHAPGQVAVEVRTARGRVMLAVDVCHFYANLLLRQPFLVTDNHGESLRSYQRLVQLAESVDHIVPGHDPKVGRLYPAVMRGKTELICLHEPPRAMPEGWLARIGIDS